MSNTNNNNPYSKADQSGYLLKKYQEKLEERNNNQGWILSNYFGRTGGGAPLRDKDGKLITRIKTIADGNIHRFVSKEFSKGDDELKTIVDYSVTTPLPRPSTQQQQFYDLIQPNNMRNENMAQTQRFPQGIPQMNKQMIPDDMNKQMYLNQFKQNNIMPFPYSMYPYPFPIPYMYPPPPPQQYMLPGQNIHPYPYLQQRTPLNNNINNSTDALGKPTQQIPQNINANQPLNNNQLTIEEYARPSSPNPSQREIQKQQWQNDLLKQIHEKQQRDENEKRKMIEMDKMEEIKYQEYLQIKKQQAEQQEQKRKNKLNKKINAMNESMENYNNSNNNILNDNAEYSNNNNNILEQIPYQNNMNQMDSGNNNSQNLLQQSPISFTAWPYDEIRRQNEFKNWIDNQYRDLSHMWQSDLDQEMKRISDEYNSKYTDSTRELLAKFQNQPEKISSTQEQSERRLRQIQDQIEQRRLVDFIFDNNNSISNTIRNPQYNNPEIDVPVPSFFGSNRESNANKYNNLNSVSTFVEKNFNWNNKNSDDQNVNCKANKFKEQGDKTLNNESSFVPVPVDVSGNLRKKAKFIKGQAEYISLEDKMYKEMFDKLDQIGDLSKTIDPSAKVKNVNNHFNVDIQAMKEKENKNYFKEEQDWSHNILMEESDMS